MLTLKYRPKVLVGELQWLHVHVELTNGIICSKLTKILLPRVSFHSTYTCKNKVLVFYGEYSMGNLLLFQCYLQTMSQLEIRIAELRAWLYQMEAQLMKPLVFATCSKEVLEAKIQEHEVSNL
jgi:hypothetical protein